jgi:DNA mismatch repair protein MutS2
MLQYMFQWGLLIPASEVSEFRIFDDIFIDIGDEQSIENDLSTYSSHLTNMKDLVSRANDKSLVLIDEFGSGTEPAAGGAIAETILSNIEKKGVYGIITTHYSRLKEFAVENGIEKAQKKFVKDRLTFAYGDELAFYIVERTDLRKSELAGILADRTDLTMYEKLSLILK